MKYFDSFQVIAFSVIFSCFSYAQEYPALKLNEREYFEMPGLNVLVFQNIYPEGHQGGIEIIQNGERVATNGDLRLDVSPGQWQPIPKQGMRFTDKANNQLEVSLTYPDSARNQKGFNPINYPNLYFNYKVKVKAEGAAMHIIVDIDRVLPDEWIGKVGFNFELYPACLFGKGWYMDQQSGIFPRQANGPMQPDATGEIRPLPFASGKRLVIAPESDAHRMVIESKKADLQLFDDRNKRSNGWFMVRSIIPKGAMSGAIEWIITPNAIPDWKYKPVIHVSQVGYHPGQQKVAVIELDASDSILENAVLMRISEGSKPEHVLSLLPDAWGIFLRYYYALFDFSNITREGLYYIQYADSRTDLFRISADIYKRDVWQPTLEYFLPVQMCHMRVGENSRVWHGLCHMDDALMAPIDHNHFDGYKQGPSTLTRYKPFEPVPGLNHGGWHDAGDDDLRIESQAGEVYILSLAYEAFHIRIDNTSIDQENHLTLIHQPDGKSDLLQQIEHGAISVVNGYYNLGRLYRGIISPTLNQYILSGDVSNQTDNLVYDTSLKENEKTGSCSGKFDDRWVFTEKNPQREFLTIAEIATASRVLKGYNDTLAVRCLSMAEELWKVDRSVDSLTIGRKIQAAIELYLTTHKDEYKQFIIENEPLIKSQVKNLGWIIGRALPVINDERFSASVKEAVARYAEQIASECKENPFGVPYKPYIWGAGWNIQKFGVEQYFLHTGFPDLIGAESFLDALSFVLGCHPGENTASFVSGVGSRSMIIAYGYNRADWSYIPGGVVSGTALIRPDFPEMKDFPFLWQQSEYVLGGGASNFMFLVLAADEVLNK